MYVNNIATEFEGLPWATVTNCCRISLSTEIVYPGLVNSKCLQRVLFPLETFAFGLNLIQRICGFCLRFWYGQPSMTRGGLWATFFTKVRVYRWWLRTYGIANLYETTLFLQLRSVPWIRGFIINSLVLQTACKSPSKKLLCFCFRKTFWIQQSWAVISFCLDNKVVGVLQDVCNECLI